MIIMTVLLATAVALVVVGMGIYNHLVRLRQNIGESWSAIETELRRRYDLIPNLVETVRGYANHERGTLEAVIQARSAAISAPMASEKQVQADNLLSGSLRRLFALSESYPHLRANEGFRSLQMQLQETETRISQARRFYNATVREFNTGIESFPASLVAGGFGFTPAPYFQIENESAREPVPVRF